MSDHLDAPGSIAVETARIGPPNGDAKTDITDLFAFSKPDDEGDVSGKSILMLNVNPLTLAADFESGAEYLLLVDTDADEHVNITFRITFTGAGANQTAKLERIDAAGSQTIIASAPVSLGHDAKVTVAGPYKFFAGKRSDPFFFDLLGFINGFNFSQGDFFADKNVFGIVLEVPNHALGSTPHTTSLWARTKIQMNGALVNDDRVGRPAINTVFNHGVDKNIFNGIDPAQDRSWINSEGQTFLASFTSTIVALSTVGATLGGKGTYTTAQATGIADFLLPDVLGFDFTKPTAFPNGRTLHDDVINIELGILTNGSTLKVDAAPHTDLLPRFPYLGNPH